MRDTIWLDWAILFIFTFLSTTTISRFFTNNLNWFLTLLWSRYTLIRNFIALSMMVFKYFNLTWLIKPVNIMKFNNSIIWNLTTFITIPQVAVLTLQKVTATLTNLTSTSVADSTLTAISRSCDSWVTTFSLVLCVHTWNWDLSSGFYFLFSCISEALLLVSFK